MKLFNRTGKAQKKWHRKALFLNLGKTRIVLVPAARPKPKHVQSSVLKKEFDSSIKQVFEMSSIRKEYGPLDSYLRYCNRAV
jgi:GTPase SAR1 family protein